MGSRPQDEAPTVVIGAGVVGLAIAFRLARDLPNVVLIDRGDPGMGCSYGNAGHIAIEQVFPLPSPATLLGAPRLLLGRNAPLSLRAGHALRLTPWLLRFAWACRPTAFNRGTAALSSLQENAVDSLASLCADAGIHDQLHRRGHLILVEDPRLETKARKQLNRLRDHGIAAEWLDTGQVEEIAPGLRENTGAIHVRDTAHVADPLALSTGLVNAFVRAGGTIMRDEVRGIERSAPGDLRLQLAAGESPAKRVVIAAGAWSRPLAKQTGFDVPLETERGYHVVAKDWQGGIDLAVASLDRMTIMTPLTSGLRMTGFVELGGLSLPPDPARLVTLNRHLSELLPGAPRADRAEWMGFRPSLPDHLPVLGRAPQDERVFYAFGHQHLGLTLAGVTADAMSSLIRGLEPKTDLTPFRIERF